MPDDYGVVQEIISNYVTLDDRFGKPSNAFDALIDQISVKIGLMQVPASGMQV